MPARTSRQHLHILTCLLLSTATAARADGLPVGPPPDEAQSRPAVTPDGRGGATVSYKTTTLKVGSVHVDASGSADGRFTIAPAALPFVIEPNELLRVLAPSDSQLIFAADNAPLSGPAITCLRSGGSATAGFPVALPTPLRRPAMVPGLGGRTLLVAKDADATSFWTLRAAIIGASGQLEFSLQLSSPIQFFMADALDACSDGAGGLLAAIPYYDPASTGSKDIAVWKLAADGSRPWGEIARPMVTASNDQTDVHVVPDELGGMIMVWTDPRAVSRSLDVFALRVDKNGARAGGWPFYGRPVCDANGAQSQPRITRDGLGGVWIVWLDRRAELVGDLRYSHLLGDGELAPGFTTDGSILCDAAGAQGEAAVAGDGAGGFFAVWRDDRAGAGDLYVQHVLATGAVAGSWEPNGRVLSAAAGVQDQPAIAAVQGGRAVLAWRDARSGSARIYAAGIEDASTTGVGTARSSTLRLSAAVAPGGHARVRVTLPAGEPGVLELIDVAGRALARATVTGPLSDHEVSFGAPPALRPGLYFVRLRQERAGAIARLTVLR